ncbi:plasmodesmata-located protein 8 isoform X1 [Primulina huaijiensis]|uniref:plasmodesmata-located protein 8 isoform X1 n=2 Tax=Primulina huaijiensis TaxID=1492673 RepID=UPI003CC72DE9
MLDQTLQKYSIKTPIQPLNLFSITISFFFIIFFTNNIRFTKSYALIYPGCSQEKYQANSPYQTNLNSMLSSITSSSYTTLYNSFTLGTDPSTASPEGSVYGLYQCRGDLNLKDCSTCIASSINQIVLLCPYTYGATLQLDGCFVRYEHVDFLGKPDTNLVHKKCSERLLNDAEFLRRRDDILDDLRGAVGFRVSSVGSVEGYAQCLGDLTDEDCSSCLGNAVGKVRSLCGSAAAADMFLAQCYVRYWESGYYDNSSDSSNEDDVGKTVAIIVGVSAGVAVFIVLLSFCKKALGKQLNSSLLIV